MRDHKGNAIATLGEVAEMGGLDWRAQLRLAGVDRRAKNEPDRGYVEQPGEGVEAKKALILPDSKLRRRIEVSPTPSTPTACIRPEPDADYEPPGAEDELEELKAVGRRLDAQNDPGPPSLSPSLPELRSEPQSLVKLERTPPSSSAAPDAPTRRYVQYTAAQKEEALRRMAAGVTARRVAEDMDITPSSLSKWCKGEALPEKRKGPPSVRIESKMMAPHVRRARRVWRHGDDVRTAAAQAVLSGRTQQDVAHEFDVSSSVVSRWLTEFLKPKKKTEENMTRTAGESRYYPPKEKMKAVAALRARQKKEGGERRGQIAGVAREMGIPRELLGNWSSSGEYEPDEAPTTETLMSRPEPQPASQQLPPPVTTVQPVATTQIPAHYYAPPQPPPPPPSAPWWQGPAAVATAPASVASPQMMGLEEYIRKMVEHEVNRQVPIVVRATLEKMWGGQR